MSADTLRNLLRRIEAVTNRFSATRPLTADLLEACGYQVHRNHGRFGIGVREPGDRHWISAPRPFWSLDDAFRLIERTLPGHGYSLSREIGLPHLAQIWRDKWTDEALDNAGRHNEPGAALMVALIRALIAKQEPCHD